MIYCQMCPPNAEAKFDTTDEGLAFALVHVVYDHGTPFASAVEALSQQTRAW